MSQELTLTFTGIGVADENIDVTGGGIIQTFKASRLTNKQVAIKTDVATQVKCFYDAFVTDYNIYGAYTVTFDATTVKIEHKDDDHFDSLTKTATNITTSTALKSPDPSFTLTSQTYTEHPTDKCGMVRMNLTFTEENGGTIDGMTVTRLVTLGNPEETLYDNSSHDSNTLQLDIDRELHLFTRIAVNIGATSQNFLLTCPKVKLEIEDIVVGQAPFSYDVTIYINSFLGSEETQFALATVGGSPVYQSTNVFSGVLPGEYNAFAKDKYGCEKSRTFKVGEFESGVKNTEIFMSVKNSHYFADRTENTALSHNINNWLSYDDPYPVTVDNFYQVWASNLIVKNQFKSNYSKHTATLTLLCETDSQGEPIRQDLPITKRTDNIARDSFLEGQVSTDSSTNTMRISFTPGDIYDENGNVIGQHTYDEVLPDFYTTGMFVRINGFDGKVLSIYTDNDIEYARTNIINPPASPTDYSIHSIHEEFDYDVFDFEIQHNSLLGKEYQIEVKAFSNATTVTPTKVFMSERSKVISVEDYRAAKFHRVLFWSDYSDEEIDYTDWDPFAQKLVDDDDIPTNFIKHERSIEFDTPLKPISNAEIQAEKLDEEFVKLDSLTNAVFDTGFTKVPALYGRSLMKLFDESKYIQVDGEMYTTNAPCELEQVGQYVKVRPKLILIGGSNETNRVNKSIKRFYPVKTS